MTQTTVLSVTIGRIATVRLAPNEDLVAGLEQAAAQLGFRRALVRGGLGSLTDAAFAGVDGAARQFVGPAIELLSVSGEIALDEEGASGLSGLVADRDGAVWAGRFLPGLNPVCVTVEAVLEELVVGA